MSPIRDKRLDDLNQYVLEAFAGSAAVRRILHEAVIYDREISDDELMAEADRWHRGRREVRRLMSGQGVER